MHDPELDSFALMDTDRWNLNGSWELDVNDASTLIPNSDGCIVVLQENVHVWEKNKH